jgi:alpha-L-fucosidase
LWAGAYFSKPDWHSEYYWWPYFATPDRNVNYDIEKYSERWDKFVEFTHNQILELMSDYGKVDILWLDGGWVNEKNRNQDVHMGELVNKAREKQPGLIVVDRAVSGPHQNYLTPENRVPDTMLPYPWESCIIMGGGWSYSFDPKFKSSRELVHMLVDIVSKGGNLLLNIGPSPEGTWYDEAYARLEELGEWMAVNGEAIYNSRPVAPYKEGKVCLTRQKDGTIYAVYLGGDNEQSPPSKISLSSIAPARDADISMLGVDGTLEWEQVGEGFVVEIPNSVRKNPPCRFAWTLKISGIVGIDK